MSFSNHRKALSPLSIIIVTLSNDSFVVGALAIAIDASRSNLIRQFRWGLDLIFVKFMFLNTNTRSHSLSIFWMSHTLLATSRSNIWSNLGSNKIIYKTLITILQIKRFLIISTEPEATTLKDTSLNKFPKFPHSVARWSWAKLSKAIIQL